MSLDKEMRKEHHRLTHEISTRQMQLRALENIMKEYNVSFHPSTKRLYELIISCLKDQQGHASFDEIIAYLTKRGVDIPHTKISVMLAKSKEMRFDKGKGYWELVREQAG